MDLTEEERLRRRRRSEIQRNYVERLSGGIMALKMSIPYLRDIEKPIPQYKVIRLAIKYIRYLNSMLNSDEHVPDNFNDVVMDELYQHKCREICVCSRGRTN
ncbi:hypothetical protein GCK72_007060 [Caenorhabditis remanei]|uniref:BHLH domain-containing protein n=1 Tax=Caenorhabditis remanei TaxID=31234 RepID=A0A6A5HMS6_CAERE|nr:hypothetical protein GCK72_007060 [Caenorhabditis remanei]KAF1767102.1 hypothetical protein GCK72_007060 [Caenorhabditis remanei]